ncbi:MAG: cell division protein FtsA [Rikenellaceae bacterium]
MNSKDYIIAVDLGDSNVVVAVGTAAGGGRINVEHIYSKPSKGVRAGKIENINQAIDSIQSVLDELREQTGIVPKELYAGISGEFIYCTSHTDHVYVPDHKMGVTQQVVDALYERMNNVMVSEDRIIMERVPQCYVISGSIEVDNPVGVFGSPLSSTFNFISSNSDLYGRLDMALRRLNLSPRRIFSNAVVVGDAVLTPDEKEEGVAVIDIGGDLTDIAIYRHNILRYISTIPMGAKSINNDIRTLTIPERYIENLKLKYGCALSERVPQDFSVIIKGRSKHDHREIAVYNLAAVIEARARDIADLILQEITDSGFIDSLPYGVVLTGGSAQLRNLDELLKDVTGFDVRVAEPEEVVSTATVCNITSSADSTVVGLLLHGLKYGGCKYERVESKYDIERREREERERLEREERERLEREERERKAREEQETRERLAREEQELRERLAREAAEKRQREEQEAKEAREAQEAQERAEQEERERAERAEREANEDAEARRARIEREEREERERKEREEQVAREIKIREEQEAEARRKRQEEEDKKKREAEGGRRVLPPPPPERVAGSKTPDAEPKSKSRMKSFFESLSSKANKIVSDVNGHFDVDEEV